MSGKRLPRLWIIPAAALLLSAGCMNTAFVAGKNAYVSTKLSGEGTPFAVRVENNFRFWGLLPRLKIIRVDAVVSQSLGREVRHITGLRLTQRHTLATWILEVITLGLYNPRVLIVEGEVHEPSESVPPARTPPNPAGGQGPSPTTGPQPAKP